MFKNSSRFILTDVLPFELPVIFSNKNFAKYLSDNFAKYKDKSPDLDKMLRNFSIPHKYKIIKDKQNCREISLMNPIAQIQASYFIDKYQHNLLHYLELYGKHSLRKPVEISPTSYSEKDLKKQHDKYQDLFDVYGIEDAPMDLEDSLYFENYFISKEFNRIHSFENNMNKMIKLERRFNYLLKTDLENCFNSIYTHSISWSYYGDKDLAKQHINSKSFANRFDTLMQRSNYNETNGILIGPNLSRLFVEVIFSKIDTKIVKEFKNKDLNEEKDFKYFRYIDDIYVFFNDKNKEKVMLDIIKRCFNEYNLRLNDSKTFTESRPFFFKKKWYYEANRTVSLVDDYVNEQIKSINDTGKVSQKNLNRNKLHSKIRNVIKNNDDNKIRISNYLTSSFSNIISTYISDICKKTDNSKDKINLLNSNENISFFTTIITSTIYIVSINLSYTNVNYLFQIMSLLYKNYIKDNINDDFSISFNFSLNDIESIIESNYNKTEISNLIILLTLLEYKINKNTIENILEYISKNIENEEEPDLFIFISIAFYIYKNKLEDLDEYVNEIIKKKIKKYLSSDYYKNYYKDGNFIETFGTSLRSSSYYFFNAFYHYPKINDNNKNILGKLIYPKNINTTNGPIDIFKKYKNSFINWDQTINDSIKIMLLKKNSPSYQ